MGENGPSKVWVVVALLLAASGVRRAEGQVAGADSERVSGVHPRYLQPVCDAAVSVMRAGDALEVALAKGESLRKARLKAGIAPPAPGKDTTNVAGAEFDSVFDALDGLNAAWGALVIDFTDGRAELARPFPQDTLADSAEKAAKAADAQYRLEVRAGVADAFGARFSVGFGELVRERCQALTAAEAKDRGGRHRER